MCWILNLSEIKMIETEVSFCKEEEMESFSVLKKLFGQNTEHMNVKFDRRSAQ